MKKLITFLVFVIFISLPSVTTYAKSYTIDDIQIRGWIQPNGDVFVNEIFTYTLDGEFKEFTRTFPKKHAGQVEDFGASTMSVESPVVGYLDEDIFTPRTVERKRNTYKASVRATDETMSIFYKYTLRNAVKSYSSYSDLEVLFFEKGSNHDIDFNNVHISFVLPAATEKARIHGFMHDWNWQSTEILEDYIVFESSRSQAYTETSTRIFFPSVVMNGQSKGAAPLLLEQAIAQEEKKVAETAKKQAALPGIGNAAVVIAVFFFIGGVGCFLFFRQRRFAFFGHADVLSMDPVYLFFVDRNGKWHPRSFLAGLFSMVEKGYADVHIKPSAERFQNVSSAPKSTFAFQWKGSRNDLPSNERSLRNWVFESGHVFHLHDVAGAAKGEKPKKAYAKKQHAFERKFQEWHKEMMQLLTEAGTFSGRLTKVIKGGILVVLLLVCVVMFYVDPGEMSRMLVPIIFGGIAVYAAFQKNGSSLVTALYFGVMVFSAFNINDGNLSGSFFLLTCASALFYYTIPPVLSLSRSAFQARMASIRFRNQIKNGMPRSMTEEEQSRWLTRVYLLNRSNTSLPALTSELPNALPLAALFAMTEDPLHFVHSTWGPSKVWGAGSDASGGGGSSSGDGFSGGGGGDGGGGSGAD